MIKLVSALMGAIILVLVLCFALSNVQPVDIAFWPLDTIVHVPIYIVGLVPLAVGLIAGSGFGWAATVPHRMKVRRLTKELHVMSEKISAMQKSVIPSRSMSLLKKHFWKRR